MGWGDTGKRQTKSEAVQLAQLKDAGCSLARSNLRFMERFKCKVPWLFPKASENGYVLTTVRTTSSLTVPLNNFLMSL